MVAGWWVARDTKGERAESIRRMSRALEGETRGKRETETLLE